MSFTTYLVQQFATTHENEFFRILSLGLKQRFNNEQGEHVLVGNLNCNGHQLDAIFLSRGKFIILELKNYGGRLEFSENNEWKIYNDENLTFVHGGNQIRNPFHQVRAYKHSIIEFIKPKQNEILNPNRNDIDWYHIQGIVLFHQDIQFDNNNIPTSIRPWFRISDKITIYNTINDLTTIRLNLQDNEILRIIESFNINDTNIYDPVVVNQPPIILPRQPRNIAVLDKIIKKCIEELNPNNDLQKVLTYYYIVLEYERYKQPEITDEHKYPIDWDNAQNFVLDIRNNRDFFNIYEINLGIPYPKDLFIGIEVKLGNERLSLFYNTLNPVSLTDRYNINLDFCQFELNFPELERKGLTEDRIEDIRENTRNLQSISEKIIFIEELLEIEINFTNRLIIGLSENAGFSLQLLSELKKIVRKNPINLKNKIFGNFLHSTNINNQIDQVDFKPFIQTTELNESQKKAIQNSFEQPLTVITGPPGTGKSVVVMNIIANAIVNNFKVLFASKNNKAVDTVKERIDKIFQFNYLLRFGNVSFINSAKINIADLVAKKQAGVFIDLANMKSSSKSNLSTTYLKIDEIITQLNRIPELEKLIGNTENELNILNQNYEQWINSLDSDLKLLFFDNEINLNINIAETNKLLNDLNNYNKNLLMRIVFYIFSIRKFHKRINILNNFLHTSIKEYIDRKMPIYQLNVSKINSFINNVEFIFKLKQSSEEIIKTKKVYKKEIDELIIMLLNYQDEYNRLIIEKPKLEIEKKQLEDSIIDKSIDYLNSCIADKLNTMNVLNVNTYEAQIPFEGWRQVDLNIFRENFNLFTNEFYAISVVSLSTKKTIPLSEEIFDLVVIDEASQCDLASVIPLIYRAKRVVIIGDPLQLKHIPNLENNDSKYIKQSLEITDPQINYVEKSLFDYANIISENTGLISTFLNEHFRCHKDIIQFSISNYYLPRLGQELINKTKIENFLINPKGIFWLNVNGMIGNNNNVNQQEINRCYEIARYFHGNYPNASIGITTPFKHQGEELKNSKPNDLQFVIADTVNKFQGDEKDIMILSMVVNPTPQRDTLSWFINEGAPYLLNVAVTRAKNTLVIVGNYDYCIGQFNTYLSKLALYVNSLGHVYNDIHELLH